MGSKNKIKNLVVLALGLCLLTGCWDRRELEDQAFVQAIGIDKGNNEQLLITFRIAIPSKAGLGQAGGGGGGGGEGSVAKQASLLTTVTAPTIPAAITLASGYVNRELNLTHTKAIVFGETFARAGVSPVMGILARYRQIRRNVFMGVTQGEAHALLQNNAPDLEKSYAKWWEGVKLMGLTNAIHTGALFQEFITDAEAMGKSGTMMYLAVNKQAGGKDPHAIKVPPSFNKSSLKVKAGEIPRIGGNPVEYYGTAIFKGDKMVDVFDLIETRALLAMQGKFRKGFLTIPDPLEKKQYIPLEIKLGSPPRVEVSLQGDRPVIKQTIFFEGDLIAIQSKVNYATDLTKQRFLESFIEQRITQLILSTAKKMQRLDADAVGFGDYFKRLFLTKKEWDKFNWPEKFPEATIVIKISFDIRRTGMQGDQPEIKH